MADTLAADPPPLQNAAVTEDPPSYGSLPSRPPRPGYVQAQASAVSLRREGLTDSSGSRVGSGEEVLNFRITLQGRTSEVELRGLQLRGSVRDGDWVELPERPDGSGRYDLHTLMNLTTGSEVSAGTPAAGKAFNIGFVFIFLIILAVAAFIAYSALRHH